MGKQSILSNLDAQEDATRKAAELANRAGYSLDDINLWEGTNPSVDFYRIRNAEELALRHFPAERIEQYSVLAEAFRTRSDAMNSDNEVQTEVSSTESPHSRLASVLDVMTLFSNRLRGNHIRIDLQT